MSAKKTYLDVPYALKDLAKTYGARWDANVSRWYYLPGSKLAKIFAWRGSRGGLRGIGGRLLLNVPEDETELAAELGAATIEHSKSAHYQTRDKATFYTVRDRTKLAKIYKWRKTGAQT